MTPTSVQTLSHSHAQQTFEDTSRLADVVKLSDEDAAWLYPGHATAEVARRIFTLGVKFVALTSGAHGPELYSNSAHVYIPALQFRAADTVGAGDSYMSPLIISLMKDPARDFGQERLQRLGRTAKAAASITVTRDGANPPTAAEIQAALAVSLVSCPHGPPEESPR
ncbi:PfkB family carbohydrate kinase [Paenarthrobacter sp. TYUT067]|uniref:PfkB family carbohydrate kinase n=1 Tax=Paenarthrobacter sp. TYUT067 TaxID=2926245 RepID=UPI0027E11F8F|nr:PfkB family carbohydrate kinase [Paenarthrobacter sp. TYUT067]